MPVLIVADLHLDHWNETGRDPLACIDAAVMSSLDGLIVAGDLANKPKVRWPHMIRQLARYVEPSKIHLLPGNHDYYDHALDGDERLAVICAETGARFMQKAVTVIGTTRYLSCTLWTDFAVQGDPAAAMLTAQREMNDYRYIRHIGAGYRRIWPSDSAIVHNDHRKWLETCLETPFPGRTIVVTHHCPHPGLISAAGGKLDPIYGSNLVDLIERFQPAAWLYGHTHYRLEALVGQTMVRNVSLGYPRQVPIGTEAEILLRGLLSDESTIACATR